MNVPNLRRRLVARLMCSVTLALCLASCVRHSVESTGSFAVPGPAPGDPARRPARVIVQDFATSPAEVQLDSGVSAELARASQGEPPDAERVQIAMEVRDIITATLVQRVEALGLP